MIDWLARRFEVSPTVAALVLALTVVQLATQVYALVDLVRRDTPERQEMAALLCVRQPPGAIIIWPLVGPGPRRRGGGRPPRAASGNRAVDALYSPSDKR
jgi:hypothetical protein